MLKRQRTEEHLNEFFNRVISRDEAFVILTKIDDVGDLMKFMIAQGKDNRFQSIVVLMQEDTIWKYWFYRDLFHFEPAWVNDKEIIDRPRWKVAYLWYRLAIAFLQRIYVYDIPHVRFVRLNLLQSDQGFVPFDSLISTKNLLEQYNFEKYWFESTVQEHVSEMYQDNQILENSYMEYAHVILFLLRSFNNNNGNIAVPYENLAHFPRVLLKAEIILARKI